jgi:prepilin-type N-terminal cleavage/methylation domain-containing protein
MTAKHRRGFTLVELLVVISIIALLISILLPSLKKARDQAKRTVCASRLKSISTALWNYWTENEGRVPYVVSPMNDGEATVAPNTLGFDSTADDDELDPFNRFAEETPEHKKGWPMSLPNVLMPTYLGSEDGVFVCPAAVAGWPRNGEPYRMTFRPAAVNQPNGALPDPSQPSPGDADSDHYDYDREFFGFLDGRMFKPPKPVHSSGKDMMSIIRDAQRAAFLRGVFVRDMARVVDLPGGQVDFQGPHGGGANVINKRLDVEYRDKDTLNDDLAPYGGGGGLLF